MATGDITFALRGTSTTAYRSLGHKTPAKLAGTENVVANAGAIGGSYIDLSTNNANLGGRHTLIYPARLNFPATQGFSVLIRVQFKSVAQEQDLWCIGETPENVAHFAGLFYLNASTALRTSMKNDNAQLCHNNVGATWSPTANVWYDLFFRTTGTAAANGTKLYVDGSLLTNLTPSFALDTPRDTNRDIFLMIGAVTTGSVVSNMWLGEMVIFEGDVDPSTVLLVGGGTGLTGAARTQFVAATALNALDFTDPGVSTVKTGTGYTYAGVAQTGTYTGSDRWSDPGSTNVKSGIGYTADAVSLTGSLVSTDPGVGNVVLGTSYIINSATLTGTFSAPSAVVVNSTLDLGALKDNIKAALDDNNVAVGAPVGDLSSNMSKRVAKVLTVNPEEIRPSANLMPAVCVFIPSKTPKPAAININQASVKRQSKVIVTIAGLVWNQNFQGNIYDDKAARDLEYLMENIEKVLRGYSNLSYCSWQFPTDVTYHHVGLDEETNFKVGFMDVEFTFFY